MRTERPVMDVQAVLSTVRSVHRQTGGKLSWAIVDMATGDLTCRACNSTFQPTEPNVAHHFARECVSGC